MEQLRLWDGLPPTPIQAARARRVVGQPLRPFDPDVPRHPGADVIPLWLARQRRGVKSSTDTLNSTERRA